MQEKKEIVFTVPGEPRPKGRPRFTRQGFAYTPKETREYEAYLRECYLQNSQGETPHFPKGEAVYLQVTAYMPIPKSWSEKKKELARHGLLQPAGKPDLDNILKAVCDAINGVAFYDDSQICITVSSKVYSDTPRVEVRLCRL